MGGASFHFRVDSLLAWCPSVLGLPQTEIYCAVILRVRNHRAIGSSEGGHLAQKIYQGTCPIDAGRTHSLVDRQ